jgi:hypothetical protein
MSRDTNGGVVVEQPQKLTIQERIARARAARDAEERAGREADALFAQAREIRVQRINGALDALDKLEERREKRKEFIETSPYTQDLRKDSDSSHSLKTDSNSELTPTDSPSRSGSGENFAVKSAKAPSVQKKSIKPDDIKLELIEQSSAKKSHKRGGCTIL